jgi:hypothetical protein
MLRSRAFTVIEDCLPDPRATGHKSPIAFKNHNRTSSEVSSFVIVCVRYHTRIHGLPITILVECEAQQRLKICII